MLHVNAAAEEVNVGVMRRLGCEETIPASEDDICVRHEQSLATNEIRRRMSELRELIHAVVHDSDFIECAEHCRCGHRRVEPLNSVRKKSVEPAQRTNFSDDEIAYSRDRLVVIFTQLRAQSWHCANDILVRHCYLDAVCCRIIE